MNALNFTLKYYHEIFSHLWQPLSLLFFNIKIYKKLEPSRSHLRSHVHLDVNEEICIF